MESFILIISFIVLAVSYYYKKVIAPYNHIAGPSLIPILGNAWPFFGCSNAQNLVTLRNFSNKYRPTWKIFLGPFTAFIFIEDPKDVEHVLSSQKIITKSDDYTIIKVNLDKNMLNQLLHKFSLL